MVVSKKGGLSTPEQLVSKNPAAQREGQRRLQAQPIREQEKTISRAQTISSKGYTGTVSATKFATKNLNWRKQGEKHN